LGAGRDDGQNENLRARLVDATTGRNLWADSFSASDPGKVYDELTDKIVGSVAGEEGRIRTQEYAKAWSKDPVDLDEYDYYLRGHDLFMRFESKDTNNQAYRIWHDGSLKYPDSQLLKIAMAWYFYADAAWFWQNEGGTDYKLAEEYAREVLYGASHASLQIERLGHSLLAAVYANTADGNPSRFQEALKEAKKAVEISPYDTFMLGGLSSIAARAGDREVALEWIERARNHSPRFENYWALSMIEYIGQNYDAALSAAEQENRPYLQRDKLILLASILMKKGETERARAIVGELAKDTDLVTAKLSQGGYSYSDPNILRQQ